MKNFLFLSTAAMVLAVAADVAAQTCTKAPTCESLGYKYSEFTCKALELKFVSCPFDISKVACISKLPGVSSSGTTNVKEACEEAGYPYSTAQCGKIGDGYGVRQIGIRCPYSSSYYYCDHPNKNAKVGWFLCKNGTAASSFSECSASSGGILGIVIKAPTSYSNKGVVALINRGDVYSKGSGIGFNAWCANASRHHPAIQGFARAPYYDEELKLIYNQFSKIQAQNSSINYPLWGNACWAGSSGGNSCKAMGSNGKVTDRNNNSDAYGICVADF